MAVKYKRLAPPDFVEDEVIEDVMIDGVRVGDLQEAIRAAWSADPAFAAEIAKRYGFYDRVCLRCVKYPIRTIDPTRATVEALGVLAYQLCIDCGHIESLKQLERMVAKIEKRI